MMVDVAPNFKPKITQLLDIPVISRHHRSIERDKLIL